MAQPGQRKVIIALDGSEEADNAFNYYLANMKQPNDYVHGIVVPEYNLPGVAAISMVGPLADQDALLNEFKSQHQVVEKLCADYTAKLRAASCRGQVDQISSGMKPGETLVDQVDKLGADAVVMGTRGLSGLKKMLLGSVSNYVVHHANCPVTVVPKKKS